jgi:hypothetical protein
MFAEKNSFTSWGGGLSEILWTLKVETKAHADVCQYFVGFSEVSFIHNVFVQFLSAAES